MSIFIIANEDQRSELLAGVTERPQVEWLETLSAVPQNAGVVVDLLFDAAPEGLELLRDLHADVLVVNSVTQQVPEDVVRICGWSTFLQGGSIEATGGSNEARAAVTELFSLFGKQVAWLPDTIGFITPRVISGIINEAYFALSEGVSDKASIDTALQLGTNYPFGPFAWSEKIGLKKVAELLRELSNEEERYAPCALLVEEAGM